MAPRLRPDIFAMRVPLADILTVRQSFPKFGNPSLHIIVTDQVHLLPFYFYEGGVRELIKILQQMIRLSPSQSDPDLYSLSFSSLPFGFHLPPPPSEMPSGDLRPFQPAQSSPQLSTVRDALPLVQVRGHLPVEAV
jgi:hypothetical protein